MLEPCSTSCSSTQVRLQLPHDAAGQRCLPAPIHFWSLIPVCLQHQGSLQPPLISDHSFASACSTGEAHKPPGPAVLPGAAPGEPPLMASGCPIDGFRAPKSWSPAYPSAAACACFLHDLCTPEARMVSTPHNLAAVSECRQMWSVLRKARVPQTLLPSTWCSRVPSWTTCRTTLLSR